MYGEHPNVFLWNNLLIYNLVIYFYPARVKEEMPFGLPVMDGK